MSIRPPRPARPKRDVDRMQEIVVVCVVALFVTTTMLRALMALLEIHPWTSARRLVDLPTALLVVPLERWGLMQRELAGELRLSELTAAAIVAAVALFVLSTLANRPA